MVRACDQTHSYILSEHMNIHTKEDETLSSQLLVW